MNTPNTRSVPFPRYEKNRNNSLSDESGYAIVPSTYTSHERVTHEFEFTLFKGIHLNTRIFIYNTHCFLSPIRYKFWASNVLYSALPTTMYYFLEKQ